MTAEGLERHRFSVSDLDRMTDAGVLDPEGRWELIDGEVVPMAAQHTSHGRMAFRLAKCIDLRVDQKMFEVYAGVTVELDQFTRVDPDISIAKAGLTTKTVRASDVFWAIEVSEATRRKDLNIKAPLYAEHGVRELLSTDPAMSRWGFLDVRDPLKGENWTPSARPVISIAASVARRKSFTSAFAHIKTGD